VPASKKPDDRQFSVGDRVVDAAVKAVANQTDGGRLRVELLQKTSLENLKNVKGVTWSHGPSMESPCLEAEAKNHSSPSLRLLLKRFWNRLSYLRSTHLSGTPSNTTNVLLMPAESYKPIRRTRSARNRTARLSLASEKQSGTRACPTRTPPSHSYQLKAG